MNSFASFQTNGAHRYLEMLCTHFGRKVEVKCDSDNGWVQFPMGRCEMTAHDTGLDLLAAAEDQAGLDQVTQLITSHLERFAFRENPTLVWERHPK